MLKVAKFGGSSLADSIQFRKVKNIIEADPARQVIVVSAPGRRFKDDTKVTDLLYLCHSHLKYGLESESVFSLIEERFYSIRNDLDLPTDLEGEFNTIKSNFSKNISLDYLASRGEYLNAKLMADFLGYKFIDSKEWVAFGNDGRINEKKTSAQIKEIFELYDHIVLPGFYGSTPDGNIKTFTRGGSDITGSYAAAGLDADIYENWTDVTGILMVDPRIVENAETIPSVTYDELRELSYMGANVLHEDAVYPIRVKDIPLNIRNTNAPEKAGTISRESFPASEDRKQKFVTGITGKKAFSMINLRQSNVSESMWCLRKVLQICDRYGLHVSQIPSGFDSFSVIVPTQDIGDNRDEILEAIRNECHVFDVDIQDGLSLIAIVGRHMSYQPGISGKLFSALGENNINIRTISQNPNEISIVIGVETSNFEKTIRVLYDKFAKENELAIS